MPRVVLVVVERRERGHEQHPDDAPPVRELVVRRAVQNLCRDGAERPPGDVEPDITPAVGVEVVEQGRHVARETVDVGHGRERGRRVAPAGERGADVMDVLGGDGMGDSGHLSDRKGAMEVKENGRTGRVSGRGIG